MSIYFIFLISIINDDVSDSIHLIILKGYLKYGDRINSRRYVKIYKNLFLFLLVQLLLFVSLSELIIRLFQSRKIRICFLK